MTNPSKVYFKILIAGLFLVYGPIASAAVLYVAPPAKNVAIGEEFFLDAKINTEGVAVNAAQAVVHFPNSILTAVSIDKAGSIFNFWVEDPVISNDNGTINFIGGTPKGVSGDTLQLLHIKFKATGSGSADITFSDAVVTASDGKGTNVLSGLVGSKVSSGGVGAPVIAPVVNTPKIPNIPKIEAPKPVERVAVSSKKLPNQPQVSIPLYPDPLKWYSYLGDAVIFWEVPDDVTSIAAKLDHNPNTDPNIIEKELFTGKNFGPLEEGVWYAHVKFKNNVGWGPVAHYKISIDRTAPAAFEIKTDNPVTGNPSPTIRYETSDALSGLGELGILIDDKDLIKVGATSTSFVLPLQPPGKHRLVVRVVDKAGNAIEDDQDIEILPLEKPSVDFTTKSVAQGEVIFVSGESEAGGFVDIVLKNSDGVEKAKVVSVVDNTGKWKATIEEFIPLGVYSLTAVARDNRGALSYPTDPIEVRVKPKTIISIGYLELGWFEIMSLLGLLIAAGAGFLYWLYAFKRAKRGAYKTIIGRDIEKFTAMLESDLRLLKEMRASPSSDKGARAEMETRIAKMQEKIDRMKKYLPEEMDKMK